MKYNLGGLVVKGYLLIACLLLFVACGVNQQAKQIKALEKCHYEVQGIDRVELAGTDILQLLSTGNLELSRLSGIAFGMLSKEVPLDGLVRIKIKNPTGNMAGINQFRYQLQVEGKEVAEGIMDQRIALEPGEEKVFPIQVNANVYGMLSNRELLNDVIGFLNQQNNEQQPTLTVRLKPTLTIGNQSINYPGWISFDKKLDLKALVR